MFKLLRLMLVPLVGCAPHGPEKTELRGGDCSACHQDEHTATRSPPHGALGFGASCGDCHDEAGWQPAAGFAHVASFPLTLGHAAPSCESCHARGYTAATTSSDCVDCHGARAEAVVDPVHAGLSQSCFACHRTDSFFPARFLHSWPLEGAHTLTSCGSCHGDRVAVYEGTSTACIDCHQEERARADGNVSGHAGFPEDCASCHGFDKFP